MTLTSVSLMWVVMVQHKTSDQYLTSGKVSTRSIHRFKRYRLLKTLSKNFNIFSNADADMDNITGNINKFFGHCLVCLLQCSRKDLLIIIIRGLFKNNVDFCSKISRGTCIALPSI